MRNWFLRVFFCYLQNVHDFGEKKLTQDTICKRCGITLGTSLTEWINVFYWRF